MCNKCTSAATLADLRARFEVMAADETDPVAARRLRHVLDELALVGSRRDSGACECDVVWVDEPSELRVAR